MAKQDSLLSAAFLLLMVIAARAGAQVVETPVPFDIAARVRHLTPALVARFELKPPVWPVEGDFVEARLYAVSSGGTVLSVERANGQVERYALDETQVGTLRAAVDSALLARAGTEMDEPRRETVGNVRGAFARNQMILSAIVYGPLVASFADDGNTATALYLLSVGTSFFLVNNLSKYTNVTRTQNDLATDGAIRGYAGMSGLLFAFGGEDLDRKAYSAIGLAGAIGGSKAGFEYGRRLTDSEAQAARKVSTLSGATVLGVLGSLGMFEESNQERPAVGAIVAGGLAGYVVGPAYPRRPRYTVTAADVRLLPIGALIGAIVGAIPMADSQDENSPLRWGMATAGMLGGVAIVDRTWVRRYDHTHGDATQIWLGTLAGSLMGGALAVLTRPIEEPAVLALLSGGAFLGALGAQSIAKPDVALPRGAPLNVIPRSPHASLRAGYATSGYPRSRVLHVDFTRFALAAAGVPGRYPLISVRF